MSNREPRDTQGTTGFRSQRCCRGDGATVDRLVELPQEPARRLLCRALEILGPRELGLRVVERLVRDETDASCGSAIGHLHALLGWRARACCAREALAWSEIAAELARAIEVLAQDASVGERS